MDATTEEPKSWSSAQAYVLAIICLVLGIVVGYLLHAPSQAEANVPPAPSVAGTPSMAGTTNGPMPSAGDLQRMAEKQAAPLLAELQKQPKDAALLAKIGTAFFAARQFQRAQQYYERSLAVREDPVVLNELSFSYYSLGDPDKAIVTLNRALKIDPNNAKAWFNLGMFQWYGKADPKAAIAAWETFVKKNPDDPKRVQVEQMIARARMHLSIPPDTKTAKPAT